MSSESPISVFTVCSLMSALSWPQSSNCFSVYFMCVCPKISPLSQYLPSSLLPTNLRNIVKCAMGFLTSSSRGLHIFTANCSLRISKKKKKLRRAVRSKALMCAALCNPCRCGAHPNSFRCENRHDDYGKKNVLSLKNTYKTF